MVEVLVKQWLMADFSFNTATSDSGGSCAEKAAPGIQEEIKGHWREILYPYTNFFLYTVQYSYWIFTEYLLYHIHHIYFISGII